MLSAIVTVKASVMDLVENVTNARNLEAVDTWKLTETAVRASSELEAQTWKLIERAAQHPAF